MFDLKNAGVALRKAAALNGIKTGQYEPITDQFDGPSRLVARVTDGKKTVEMTQGDLDYAYHLTWKEIK